MLILATLISLVDRAISAGSYIALFGLLFACGLGLPLPEDIPLLLGGFLSAKGTMSLPIAAVVAWCGIIGGDIVLYHLGKRYGLGITRVRFIGRHVTPERIRRAEVLFERYGIWVVAVGRLFAGIRGAMVIAAGAVRYNLVKFIIADGLAAMVSGGLFMLAGYWVGQKIQSVDQLQEWRKGLAGYEHWALITLVVLVLGIILYVRFRKKKHTTITDVALSKASDRVVQKHPEVAAAVEEHLGRDEPKA
jgi:membrane protein DedA with SNARE-associated domain